MKSVTMVSALLICTSVMAGPTGALKKGYISNDSGDKCSYTQEIKKDNKHFHGDITGTHGVLTFDDAQCMKDSGVGLETNMMMINNIISRWYSHDDAKFKTRASELFSSSMLQKKGKCMQSETYPMIGVVLDYLVSNNSITGVIHGSSVQGCTE